MTGPAFTSQFVLLEGPSEYTGGRDLEPRALSSPRQDNAKKSGIRMLIVLDRDFIASNLSMTSSIVESTYSTLRNSTYSDDGFAKPVCHAGSTRDNACIRQ